MKHPICKYPNNKCPNMETQDNTCLLKNIFDCPMNKPEDRLLTDEEIASTFQSEFSVKGGGFWDTDKVCKLQDAKTVSIKDAEIKSAVSDAYDRGYKLAVEQLAREHKEKIAEIFEEIEKLSQDIDEDGKGTDDPTKVFETFYYISKRRLEALKAKFGGKK